MPSGLNLRQKDISVGNGINIEYSTTGSGITLSIPPMEDRLLPTGGKDGDILGYQEGVDRGNNTDTKLLIQPATSDGLIVDQAAGNAAPVDITNSGNVVIEDNALVFTGTNSLLIPANALGMTLGGNNEFMIDIEFQLDSVKSDYATLYGSDGGGSGYQGALYFTSGGDAHFTFSLGPDTTGWTLGTKHRITIERWNDNGTWKTSVYRNGSFLASSTSGMNTLSDYVFPIGSNNESTDRNFIGKIWAFRISNKAEHRGVSFTPRELPFLPPAGQPVWTEGIDRSRLLPEDPVNGDIPVYDATATIGGGNDANTRLLLQPSTSDHGIVDQAAGNVAPVTLENHNVTVDEEGNMVFDGSNAYLKIPANTLPSDFFNGTDEWTLDIVYNVTSKSRQCLFGCSSSLRMDFLLDSDGSLQIGAGPNLGTGWPFNEDVHLTFEIYKNGASWKYTIFRNGSVVTTGTWVNADWRSVDQYIGWEGYTDSRKINGKIKALRLTSGALHKGAAFQSDYPWTEPRIVGEWGKFSKNEIVKTDSNRLLPEGVTDGDIPCFDATATIGGGNNENTKILLHFDTEIKDEAAGNAAPVTIITKSGTITLVDGGKFGKCAKFVTGSMTVATNLDELNANNWVVSGWFNPDADNHGVSYPTWLSMDDSSTNGFIFDSTGRYGESDAPLFYMDTPPTAGEWHWLAIVKYSGGLRFYLNGAFLNEIVSSQMANFCSTLAIGGFAGTYAAGSTERTFSGLVDEVRLQYIPEDEISKWTGTSIAVPTEPYTVKQIVGEWGLINKISLVNSINGITPDDTGNVTLDLLTEEQLSKLNSIVLANDFTFTQSDIVSNMITKNATTLGVPAGSMVQVLSNTGIVMTERAGILVYWSGNNLIIDFTGYFNTTQTTLTGTWTVKFAGNFVGSGSGGSGTVAAIAYPIVLVKPAYTEAVHLEMVYATQDDYSDAQTLVNTKTTSADRSLVKAFGGTAWETCPSGGFGSVYDKQPVKIIVSSKLDATTIYNIKYRWISASSDTSISEWYGMVYPCYSVPQ